MTNSHEKSVVASLICGRLAGEASPTVFLMNTIYATLAIMWLDSYNIAENVLSLLIGHLLDVL